MMPDNSAFRIRPMSKNDLEEAICLSGSEGWNQTEKDWKLLFEGPGNICLVAEYTGKLAGTATALSHSGKVAWIGMVLVDKELRGQGIGKALLVSIIEKLSQFESIKLDATPAGLPLYQGLGFKEEYGIIRLISPSFSNFYFKYPDGEPVHIDAEGLTGVLGMDKYVFGSDRSYLLKTIYQNYPLKAYLSKHDGKIDGYIFGRDGIRFNYIGPVTASTSDSARSLIAKALVVLDNQPVALDIPEDKEDLLKWLESIGFVRQRSFVRMYLKGNPYPGIPENQYLISGPEFG